MYAQSMKCIDPEVFYWRYIAIYCETLWARVKTAYVYIYHISLKKNALFWVVLMEARLRKDIHTSYESMLGYLFVNTSKNVDHISMLMTLIMMHAFFCVNHRVTLVYH